MTFRMSDLSNKTCVPVDDILLWLVPIPVKSAACDILQEVFMHLGLLQSAPAFQQDLLQYDPF